MKYFNQLLSVFLLSTLFIIIGCVHDEEYDDITFDGNNFNCENLVATTTLAELQAMYTALPSNIDTLKIADDLIIEGYVSSSDESGNIYKNIFIQNAIENPTHGFTLSVNSTNNYSHYPKGSKIFVKLKDLYIGQYGGVMQVGDKVEGEFDRIPENKVNSVIVKSCDPIQTIIPKVVTLNQLNSSFNPLIGCLIQVNNAEFSDKHLCETYSFPAETLNKELHDPTFSGTTRIVRNSGYASFANQLLPTGNGKFIGVLSKYSTTFQFYVNSNEDLDMKGTRLDGIVPACTTTGVDNTSVAEVKALLNGSLTQITEDLFLEAVVTANDKTGNHYKYVYIQDETGGIRFKLNKTDLFLDDRFVLGNTMLISLKDLYLGTYGGEIQLGGLYNNSIGNLDVTDIPKHVFRTDKSLVNTTAKEITLDNLSFEDVGRWVKIKDVQFIDEELGKFYSEPTTSGNRTMEDCAGNNIIMRTSNFADLGEYYNPIDGTTTYYAASTTMIDGGKGDVYAILSYFNGTYQLLINNLLGADLDGVRCDGSTYSPPVTLFEDDFAANNLNQWTTVNVTGAQVWNTSNQGTGNYYLVMNGYSGGAQENEDWIISNPIDLTQVNSAKLNFDNVKRYSGNDIEVFYTTNYTNNVTTTNWVTLSPNLDTNIGSWTFVNSGDVDLTAAVGNSIRIAFKYTSTTSAACTWEIDNVKVTGSN